MPIKILKKVFSQLRVELYYLKFKPLLKNYRGDQTGEINRLFVIGSGNSVKNLDLSKLKNENVIVLNNGCDLPQYDTVMSGSGLKIHLIAPIHPPQTTEEWVAWFSKLEAKIPQEVQIYVGLNSYKQNACNVIKEHTLFEKHQIKYYFAERSLFDTYPFKSNYSMDFSLSLESGKAASIYAMMLAEFMKVKMVYLLGLDHDYFLYDSEKDMRAYESSEHQNNEFKRTFGDTFYIEEFKRQYEIFLQYRKIDLNSTAKFMSCSGPILKLFSKVKFDDLF